MLGGSNKTARERRSGFTLIEVLVVVSILATLFGLVVATTSGFMGRASEKATVSMVLRLQTWLDEYRSLTGYYPPDGFDSRQRTPDGTELRGTASLYYALTTEVLAEEFVGSRRRWRKYQPVAKIESSELTSKFVDYPGAREILDGWGNEMHYDNTANGKFVPQDGAAHYVPVDVLDHPEDPREEEREIDGKPVVRRRGIQGAGYDLWSHGQHGHDRDAEPSMPIASWNAHTQN